MKIIGGKFKGRNFYMPKGIRPTQNILREAIFNILGQDLSGLVFLDLFSGSGAIGLEAVSRGAQKVVFVERDMRCTQIIEENLTLLKDPQQEIPDIHQVVAGDAFAAIKKFKRENKLFDIVFLDPPFGQELAKKALKTLSAYAILQRNCFIIIQHDKHEILPDSEGRFSLVREGQYGASRLSLYQENNQSL